MTVKDFRKALRGRNPNEKVVFEVGVGQFLTISGVGPVPVTQSHGSGHYRREHVPDMFTEEAIAVHIPREEPL